MCNLPNLNYYDTSTVQYDNADITVQYKKKHRKLKPKQKQNNNPYPSAKKYEKLVKR